MIGIRIRISRVIFCLCILVSTVSVPLLAQNVQELPSIWTRVTDETGILKDAEKIALEQKLESFEHENGSQIIVVIVSTTSPESIEEYTIRLAQEARIGRENVDDGIVMLIAADDRRMRIEVGYGLEGAIPDAIAYRIINDYLKPNFRKGDYYGGINEGIDALINLVEGEELPEPASRPGSSEPSNQWFFLLFIIAMVIGQILRAVLGRGKGIGLGAVLAFLGGWLIISLSAGFIIAVMYLIFTGIGGVGGGHGGRGGGFGGGFGGGSFSGGGFSGGGGSFGGGGASGSW